jgi:hypothetical protein
MAYFFLLNILFLFCCFVYCIVEPKIKKAKRSYIVTLLIFFFSLLMAFRPINVKDTINYVNFFNNLNISERYHFDFLQKYNGMEYGFLYLNLLIKIIFKDYKVLFFIIAFFNTYISVSCLKRMGNYMFLSCDCKHEFYGAALIGYIAYAGVLYCGITLRGGLSISLGLLAIDCFLRKKYIPSIICSVIAFVFQRVCIILLLALLTNSVLKKGNQKVYMFIWLFQGILLIFNIGAYCIEIISEVVRRCLDYWNISGFSGYLQNFDKIIGKIDWLIWGVIGTTVFFYENNRWYKIFLNIVLLGGWILVFLHGVRAISRMYDYCIIFCIPMLSSKYYSGYCLKISKAKIYVLTIIAALSVMTLKLSFF